MPIYEYLCDSCGHELEIMQKLADDPLEDCPGCGDTTLRKKISSVGFRLKASGWYETDFKTGDKKKNLAGDGKPAEGKSDGKAEGKSESKPESKKSESKPESKKPESKPSSKPDGSGSKAA